MKTYLVTGGNGFVGAHLVKKLSELGNNVVVFSRFERKNPMLHDLIKTNSNIYCRKGDITDYKTIRDAVRNVDGIFHLAADIEGDADKTLLINGKGTLNVLDSVKQESDIKVIFASTVSVYGAPEFLPIDEEHPKLPNSYYGLSKLISELYCGYYYRNYGVSTVILRLASIYGNGQELSYPNRAIPAFIRAAKMNEPINISGSGDQSRDYVYINDVVDAFISAMDNDVSGEIFNISGGVEVTTMELAKTVLKIFGGAGLIENMNDSTEIYENYLFNISKAKQLLDFNPMTISEGLKHISNTM